MGAAIVMVASPNPSYAAEALLPTEVAKIAKSTVVRIEPTINSPGSGVIIGRSREGGTNVYTVLTAAHVVQHSDDEYNVVTPASPESRQRQKISISTQRDIQKLSGVDLAIVRFRSDRNYEVATIGDSKHTIEGAGVYIAGFPNPGAAITRRVFQFTGALVSSRLDGDSVEGEQSQPLEDGYAIAYTNVTRAGMSGGPVFDVAGRVVGIHGKGDRDFATGTGISQAGTSTSSSRYADKTGFNLGIPIETFLKLRPNAVQEYALNYDSSVPGSLLGGGLIALRSGSQETASREETARIAASTNLTEEEDTANDAFVDKPGKNNLPTPITPQNLAIPQPVQQQNTSPASTPSPGGPLF